VAAGTGIDGEGREPRLDGLRGLAILLVMLAHTTRFDLAEGPLGVALTAIPSLGWTGVDLFFVLSGFLITGILLRSKASPVYYRSFYARRTLRIFPLYYAVLAFFLLLAPRLFESFHAMWTLGAEADGVWYWLYLSNLRMALGGERHPLDVSWSLAVEEHFYLIWPFVVRAVDERRLLPLCGLVAAGALAMRCALLAAGAEPVAAYVLTPARLDTLATGAALALVARRAGGLGSLARPARLVLPAALALFAAGVVALRATRPEPADWIELVEGLSLTTRPLMASAGFSLLCVLFGALLVSVLTAPPGALRARCFESRALRSLGKYSYALYLLHGPAGALVGVHFPWARLDGHRVLAQACFWLLAMGFAFALARLSWAVFEAPLLRLKRHFPY
jgi:peptidoglycan/LPS O-acetylase OafA/YrhL